MRDFIKNMHLMFKNIIRSIVNLYKLLIFIKYIHQERIIGSGYTKDILKVIGKLVELEENNYPNHRVMGRSIEESVKLFNVLSNKYLMSGSKIILEQLMQVLRVEFIERDKWDRKVVG